MTRWRLAYVHNIYITHHDPLLKDILGGGASLPIPPVFSLPIPPVFSLPIHSVFSLPIHSVFSLQIQTNVTLNWHLSKAWREKTGSLKQLEEYVAGSQGQINNHLFSNIFFKTRGLKGHYRGSGSAALYLKSLSLRLYQYNKHQTNECEHVCRYAKHKHFSYQLIKLTYWLPFSISFLEIVFLH